MRFGCEAPVCAHDRVEGFEVADIRRVKLTNFSSERKMKSRGSGIYSRQKHQRAFVSNHSFSAIPG